MFSVNHRRRSSSVTRHGRRMPRLEQLEARTLLTSWVGQIGGLGYDSVQSRAIMDTAGNMYIGGAFTGIADFDPTSSGVMNLTSAGGEDAYLAKYSSGGSLLWARRFGGSLGDTTSSVRLDATEGSLYVTGNFRGSADFTGDNVTDLTSTGAADVFVLKLDPASGSTVWQKAVGGGSNDYGTDIAAADGYVYITGGFTNTVDFNPGAGVNSLTAAGKGKFRSPDGFVLKLNESGSYVTAWQVGGEGTDSIRNVVVEGEVVYVSGGFSGKADFDPTAGTQFRTSNGYNDAFFAKYTTSVASVTLNWVQVIGGPGADGDDWYLGSDVGSLYLTGQITETVDFDPGPGTFNLTTAGSADAIVAKYAKANGSLVWARSFGGTGDDSARIQSVVNPADGSVYVGLAFSNTVDFNGPAAPGGELTSAGGWDGGLLKLDASGNYLNAWRMGSAVGDGGAKPVGIIGSTVYVAGRFEGIADFPTGGTLTSYGSADGFLMALDEATPPLSPLLAAALPANSVDQSLAVSQHEPIVAEAQRRWEVAGVNTAALSGLNVQVRNLGGTTLGLASGNTIVLDDNAAGWGWFVDSTPISSSEFLRRGNQGEQNRMDLLTVVMHELGHLLQQDHDADGVMAATLVAGVRNTSLVNEDSQVVDAVFSQFNEPHANNFLSAFPDERRWLHRPRLQRRR